ncbi:FKBP-type peptidyl-prolyl cis-trans isomerase [Flavivirga jejuensis]
MLALVLSLFVSCSKDEVPDYVTLNDEEITDYIAENNLDATKSVSGLYYVIDEEGTGEQPTITSNVTVAYKGYFTNGSVFDESDSLTYDLDRFIAGWREGFTYFKEGGSGKLLVPSHLGYGNDGIRGIPGGAVLIFDISLISVN